ncbi:MAG: dephospho-CoA kinase [Desulfonatronovibrio sp. MSAO_Bac4]|nr:MAG: dephospho-CoA kinase [Desulfonatronovibrio sp. MSAO_Bac4]
MTEKIAFLSSGDEARIRLDLFLVENFPEYEFTRSQVGALIKNGHVLVDGKACLKPSYKVVSGQVVKLNVPVEKKYAPVPLKGEIKEVFENGSILVLDKQPGLSVHPAPSIDEPTLVNYLLEKYPQLRNSESDERPGIVHRLDKDTSGLMVVALDSNIREFLQNAFQDRLVNKKYLALIKGCPDKTEGEINLSLNRDHRNKTRMAVVKNGRSARTKYKIIYAGVDKKWSLVLVQILTGRTHQIRVHMSSLRHPVLGDNLYGGKIDSFWGYKKKLLQKLVKRQLLHSIELGFNLPHTDKYHLFFQAPPKDFQRVFFYLERHLQKVIITGSMGSGKSLVMFLLRELKYPVFMADECVNDLYQPGNDGWRMIKGRFGDRFIDGEDLPVNKLRLGAAVSRDRDILKELNHLIHPLVKHRLESFWLEHEDKRVAFAEIPLAAESGMDMDADVVAGIYCPDELRYSRLAEKRKLSRDQFVYLDENQMKQAEKLRNCQLIIDNSSDEVDLKKNVYSLTRVLRYLRSKIGRRADCRFKDLMQTNISSDL